MIETKRKWWQWFPRYGKWGGPGWSAGCWNPVNTDWSVGGIDPMDELFKWHDYAYQNDHDRYKADKGLVEALKVVKVNGVYARLYRIGALVCFTVWPVIRWN